MKTLLALVCAFSIEAFAQVKSTEPICAGQECGGFKMSDEELTQDLQLLEKLVNLPSETMDIEGVTAVANLVKDEFSKLGFTTSSFVNPNLDSATQKPISADLFVAELKGKTEKFITFIVHADTVFKKTAEGKVPVPFQIVETVQMPLQIDIPGKRILGSGIGDNKGGIVMLLRTLKLVLAQGKPKYSFRVVISTNEEVGSPGHKIKMAQYGPDSIAVLGVEPSGQGNILNGRGGVHWYEVTVMGTEAHAGVAHEKGVNACLDLSIKLVKASELTNYDEKITVNIGTIIGGKRANIVCASATAVIDTRFSSKSADQELEKKFTALFLNPEVTSKDGQNLKTTTQIKTTAFADPFEATIQSGPYFDRMLNKIKQIDGLTAGAKYSRGGADIGNIINPDAIMMDGLGPVVDGSHTAFEYIILETLRSRALVLADLINQIK